MKLQIINNRKRFFLISAFVLLLGAVVILINGFSGNGFFNLDVEFSGGLSMNVDIGQDFNNSDIAAVITSVVPDETAPQVQRIAGTTQVTVKIRQVDEDTITALIKAFSERYNIEDDVFEISDISATVSREMQINAVKAVAIACALMLVYISVRFRGLTTGGAAILTVLHDALFAVACYGVLRIPVNNSFIAVILTILGYAINNNIVVLDRVRENRKLLRRESLGNIIDKSVNQSLRRCLFTTITTLLTITVLFIVGVPSIKEFALPIILGLLCGAYSSVCLSGSLLYCFTEKTL